jgi:pyruvate carboxylase subunit B
MTNKVNITETILRDAHQCLIATRMQTSDMLPICNKLNKVGYWALEAWGGATFDACLRFLKEDPWERLKALRRSLPDTRLMMLLRGQNLLGYRHYADDIVEKFVELASNNGVDVFRVFDALNDIRNLETSIRAIKRNKKHAQGTIAYTTSPVHTVETFIKNAKDLENLGCDSIAIKDMAGLLTPAATVELITSLKKSIRIPIHLHSHATSGLSMVCQWEAIKNGCQYVDTAISSFANGPSHACTESMVAALKNTSYDTGLDLQLLQEIADYFAIVRKKYKKFENETNYNDTRVQTYQVPGGMISNLYNQLREQGALEKINDVFAEIPKVRKDLGYPPLVTPTSQIVGTQAVLNVLNKQRYKIITNEVKAYLQGLYGRTPGEVEPQIKQKAIGNTDYISCRPADLLKPELEKINNEIQQLTSCPEDVLSYAMFPEVAKNYFIERNSNKLKPEAINQDNLADSIQNKKSTLPQNFSINVNGENYEVVIKNDIQHNSGAKSLLLTINGIPEEVLISHQNIGSNQNKGNVVAAMPGTVVDIKVGIKQKVIAGDVVLIVEAMKMETEIQAPISGIVNAILVKKGDSVAANQVLMEIING